MKRRIPGYRCFKPRNLCLVVIDGRQHYLGRYGSPESVAEYHRLVQEWLARGTPRAGRAGRRRPERQRTDPVVPVRACGGPLPPLRRDAHRRARQLNALRRWRTEADRTPRPSSNVFKSLLTSYSLPWPITPAAACRYSMRGPPGNRLSSAPLALMATSAVLVQPRAHTPDPDPVELPRVRRNRLMIRIPGPISRASLDGEP
jgi:hypothetical protein